MSEPHKVTPETAEDPGACTLQEWLMMKNLCVTCIPPAQALLSLTPAQHSETLSACVCLLGLVTEGPRTPSFLALSPLGVQLLLRGLIESSEGTEASSV